mmetsp:Transcript_40986/g.46568  ORF Transcript_40986/g.46568 Transcript_40986/m.46568 type:complete len:158 (-) Transcript_40986:340-813(-)
MSSSEAESDHETQALSSHQLPVTLIRSYKILGVPTDCWVQLFGDQIVLNVSQMSGKVGTMVLCQVEDRSPIERSKLDFHISTLLGRTGSEEMVLVYARGITERIAAMRSSNQDPTPAVLLGISLLPNKESDHNMFKGIVDTMVQLYTQALQQITRIS